MYSFAGMPSTASQFFSAYASLTGTLMLFRSMANEIVPDRLRNYIYFKFNSFFFTTKSSDLTLHIDEQYGYTRNQVYDAAEIYLRTKISPTAERLKVSKTPRQKQFTVGFEKNEQIVDEFEGVKLVWRFAVSEPQNPHSSEKRYFELIFDKKFKEKVFDSYLPYVLVRSNNIKDEEKVVRLYTRNCGMQDDYGGGGRGGGRGGGAWGSINLEHPATFDTIAMEPELKKSIKDDLERFLRRRDFYKKVGKAWKRGYLLYGPPGTGKSSLIAAMANYLKFDIYDLELTSLFSNSELRRILLSTTNRSILVIEDIDCSVEVQDRDFEPAKSNSKLTLSGLLNFIDGLWSSCGDERIIVFTTNHKDRLDPALLRPGRMDMHIHLSYCTPSGFKLLAGNYLGIHDGNHQLFGEIESLIESTEVTPAEIAEELMTSDDGDVALGGLVKFLKRKNVEQNEKKTEDEEGKETENIKEVKRQRKCYDSTSLEYGLEYGLDDGFINSMRPRIGGRNMVQRGGGGRGRAWRGYHSW